MFINEGDETQMSLKFYKEEQKGINVFLGCKHAASHSVIIYNHCFNHMD